MAVDWRRGACARCVEEEECAVRVCESGYVKRCVRVCGVGCERNVCALGVCVYPLYASRVYTPPY